MADIQKTINIPEEYGTGYQIFPYFVKDEDEQLAIECFASMGHQYEEGTLTDIELARQSITALLEKKIKRYQEKQAVDNAVIKTDIIS